MNGKKYAGILLAFSSAAAVSAQGTTTAAVAAPAASPWKYIAAALAVSVACISGAVAVAKIGSAAMGAMAEKPELSGKALPYVGLAEGICLWGFLVALLILLL
ncbi:MAG: ATP synthase subunit C [Rectinema sp.]